MEPIILVRHAEPAEPPEGTASHWTDTELSDLGRRQAACVARRLKDEIGDTPCAVVTSDLKRASQTADLICRALGVAATVTGELREFNNGGGIGGSVEEITRSSEQQAASSGVEGETWEHFYGRVSSCMERLVAGQDRLLVVVSHYGTMMNIVTWWLGLGLNSSGDIGVSFGGTLASIAVLKIDRRGKHVLERLNDTTHLHAAGLAGKIPLGQ